MNEIAMLMENAAHEIRDLRRRNEVLAAKVEMIDLFSLVFRTRPDYPSVGAAPDVVWELEKKAAEIHEETRPRAPASVPWEKAKVPDAPNVKSFDPETPAVAKAPK